MSHISLLRLIPVLALTFVPGDLSASPLTYEVGTCMPGLPSFPTITAALAATPAANVVMVCPGTYREQLQITQPVTLEGVSTDDSARAIIASPVGGLVTNATISLGTPVAAQLFVNSTSGPVNIRDLTVDGTGPGDSGEDILVGILYQDVSGTVSRVVARNQVFQVNGVGIWVDAFTSPSVTIENSSVHDYDSAGIVVESENVTVKPTAVIKGDEITSSNGGAGIVIGGVAVFTVTNNLIVNRGRFTPTFGISVALHGTGTISANTVVDGTVGIDTSSDGIAVTSNRIFATGTGINLQTSVAPIESNSITDSRVGIDFICSANPNVHSNIITDAGTALSRVPSAVATSNTYFNVGTIRNGSCP